MAGTALILGATGGVGGATARALAGAGWRIRALARDPAKVLARDPSWEAVAGDAMDAGTVRAAAEGAGLIVHGVNPPAYRDWDKLVLPMLDASIAAARATGARLLFPGTIYNFGPDAWPLLSEDSPQNPTTPKGRLRVEMERRLAALAEAGGRALVLRAGDFFGPDAGNSWFSQGMVTPGRPVTRIVAPGAAGTGHAWAYLPDVGAAFARLAALGDALPPFARFHLAGHWDDDGRRMTDAIARAAGRPGMRPWGLPWPLLRLGAPFNQTLAGLVEMRPLWRQPIRLDNARLVAALDEEPRTPLDEAVARTLRSLGCVP